MNTENRVLQIPIEDIIPNRFQPRLAFDDASLKELAESIKQHGIIQPLVLRRLGEKYEIIAGERRYKAATMAGLTSVPAILSNLDDNASAEVAIVENVQRKDLTAIEEARSFKALLDKGYMTQEDLAKKMGLSQAAISNKLRLLSLDESVQEAVLKEKISERHARSLLKVKDTQIQKNLLDKIINERLTVRQLEEEIKKMNSNDENNISLENTSISNIAPSENIDFIPPVFDNALEENKAEPLIEFQVNKSEPTEQKTFTSNIFSEPQQMPNRFFNFLEDEAANMSTEEPTFSFEDTFKNNELDKQVQEEAEEIEMLDFEISSTDNSDTNTTDIINKIRELNLEKNQRVVIEEISLPNEYQINIKIKKE